VNKISSWPCGHRCLISLRFGRSSLSLHFSAFWQGSQRHPAQTAKSDLGTNYVESQCRNKLKEKKQIGEQAAIDRCGKTAASAQTMVGRRIALIAVAACWSPGIWSVSGPAQR